MPNDSVTHYTWEQMPKEQVSPMLDRRLITGERLMLAHVYLKKGCIVPKHSHHNEQITYILEGRTEVLDRRRRKPGRARQGGRGPAHSAACFAQGRSARGHA